MTSLSRVGFAIVLASCGRIDFDPLSARDADAVIPDLLAWYRMEDDPTTGVLADSSGNGHDASCLLAVSCPTAIAGQIGNAREFDGTQVARVGYGGWLDTNAGFTYSVWLYIDSAVVQVAFAKAYGTMFSDSWDLYSDTNNITMESVDAAGTDVYTSGPTLPVGQWVHVAGRWTGATKEIFVNGASVGATDPATGNAFDTNDLVIGCDENTGSTNDCWHGRIDELRIYGRGLTNAEIQALAM